MIADGGALDQRVLDTLRDHDPVVRRYRAFFAHLDWAALPAPGAARPRPGPVPHPPAAYVKALLIKLCEHKEYITALRSFLVEHPLLVLEIGFRPVLDPLRLVLPTTPPLLHFAGRLDVMAWRPQVVHTAV